MIYEGGGPADPALQPAQVNPLPVRASPFFTLHGKLYHRRRGFVSGERLTCPLTHRIKRRAIHWQGAHPCTSKVGAGEECGALVFVLVFPGMGQECHLWAADVEYTDMLTMDRHRMTAGEVLAYFDALLPEAAMLRRA